MLFVKLLDLGGLGAGGNQGGEGDGLVLGGAGRDLGIDLGIDLGGGVRGFDDLALGDVEDEGLVGLGDDFGEGAGIGVADRLEQVLRLAVSVGQSVR